MAKSCWVLVAVAMALCMAAGASAQFPECFTNDKSPLLEDAEKALKSLEEGSQICLKEEPCTVAAEYKTAQLKICGEPKDCVEYGLTELVFNDLVHSCAEDGEDGTPRTAGELTNYGFSFVIKGRDKNANVAIEMKLSE